MKLLFFTLLSFISALPKVENESLLLRIEHLENEIQSAETRILKLLKLKGDQARALREKKEKANSFAEGDFIPTLPSCENDAEINLEQMWRDACKIAEVYYDIDYIS